MQEGYWALVGVATGAVITGLIGLLIQQQQHRNNKEMYLLENKAKENAKALLKIMLEHKGYTDRKFDTLSKSIGGFSDSELRKLLLEIEARKTQDKNGAESWYLLSRQDERVEKRKEKSA